MEINQERQDKEKIKEKEEKDQAQRQEINPEDRKFIQMDFNPWDYGEEVEKRRKQALSMLFAARKELAATGKVTEGLKRALQTIR